MCLEIHSKYIIKFYTNNYWIKDSNKLFIMSSSLQIVQSYSLTSFRKLKTCYNFMQIFDNGAHWRVVKALSDVRTYTFTRSNSTATKLQKFLQHSSTHQQEIWSLKILLKWNRDWDILNEDSSMSPKKPIQSLCKYFSPSANQCKRQIC